MAQRLSKKKKQRQTKDMEHIVNTKFAMKKIHPMTKTQSTFFDSYSKGYNIAGIGTAGTGKTFLSMYLALKDVMETNIYSKIVIVRSAVQSRDQGFMPGNLHEKMSYYETPYQNIVNELFDRGDAYEILKKKKMIEFMSSSFVRGLTLDNSIIIVDEAQNMNYGELSSIITRVGENSRIVFCGDTKQDDLKGTKNKNDVSGLVSFLSVLYRMDSFDVVKFSINDVVRSGIVKEYIIAEEQMEVA